MKIALAHDWITGIGGDVRVLKALHEMFSEAPIYCLYHDKKFTDEFLPGAKLIPYYRHVSKLFMPFFPSAIESVNLAAYDIVISTGSIFSKGLILRPTTYHINYCHSPTRQVWDLGHEYRRRIYQHILRVWDRHASTRVDQFVANSEHVRQRIKKYYRRDAKVIYPPVQNQISNLKNQNYNSKFKNYFLIVSRLYKHKNIDIAVRTFNKLGWNLVIIGDGPERERLERIAAQNIKFLGYIPDDQCSMIYDSCSAFIMPQEEDFGIAPIEAMSHGKPVLALKRGGALEYVRPGINGEFFEDATEEVLAYGVWRLHEHIADYDPSAIRSSVAQFTENHFKINMLKFINEHCA